MTTYRGEGAQEQNEKGMELIFMLLLTMLIISKWTVAANFFRMKTNTFQKKIATFARAICESVHKVYIITVYKIIGNRKLTRDEYFPYAKYATDIMFQ